ncbi:MAG: hypothetical protein IH585_15540 [Anaerolineaceae bacterium]|nr:hypothetical protein [Anaerolineaceae bacterium]
MDRINEGTFDQMMEDAIRCEPLVELPLDFSQLFLEQVKVEAIPKFQVLSWVDMIFSMIMAICIGTAFLITAFLPEQLTPMMQWVLQWGGYLLTKAVFSLPGIIITMGAILLAIGALIVGGKGLQNLVKFAKERRNVLSLL